MPDRPSAEVLPVPGIGEIAAGDDLAAADRRRGAVARDGDVLVVTSKIVSKAEGRLVTCPPTAPNGRRPAKPRSTGETVRVVARRGRTRIVQTHHGLVMAAAGVDASNVARPHWYCCPWTRTPRRGRCGRRCASASASTSP